MSESEVLNVDESTVSVEQAGRVKENKPRPRSTPFTAVAGSRAPGKTRAAMAADLRIQDDLVTASVGNLHFKPVTVAGVSLKLEPLQPSIGTVVHGIDLAKDLADPEMVSFLRSLWLERRVIMFRDQNHLTPRQQFEFASHFGEVGLRYGEPGHEPNSANRTHSTAIDGVPEMLVLISDEQAPAAASGWHADAHLAETAAHGLGAVVPGSAPDRRRHVLLRLLQHVAGPVRGNPETRRKPHSDP